MHQARTSLLQSQERSYQYGTLENIHNEWVFFEDDLDEAFSLHDIASEELEFLVSNQWIKGTLQLSTSTLLLPMSTINLETYMKVRFQKRLLHSLQELLEYLPDDDFSTLLLSLQKWNYSIYDCIYCHTYSSFFSSLSQKEGVNFLTLDNNDTILSVQHHFLTTRHSEKHYFEFLQSTGLKATYIS